MLKTISAGLLAASVIAAPALAAETGKSATQAPVNKADQTQSKASNAAVKPDVKSTARTDAKTGTKTAGKADARAKAMNANAAISPSEHHTYLRSHRHHHKMVSAAKPQPSVGTKPAAPVTTGTGKSAH